MDIEKILKNINEFKLVKKINELIGAHNDLSNKVTSLETSTPKIDETNLVHLNNEETITGEKTIAANTKFLFNDGTNTAKANLQYCSSYKGHDAVGYGQAYSDKGWLFTDSLAIDGNIATGACICANGPIKSRATIYVGDNNNIELTPDNANINGTRFYNNWASFINGKIVSYDTFTTFYGVHTIKATDISLFKNAIKIIPTIEDNSNDGTLATTAWINKKTSNKPIISTVILDSTKWSNNKYTISDSNVTANALIMIGLPTTATGTDIDNLAAAKLNCSNQTSGFMELTAFGTVPTTNITIQIAIIG